MNQRVRTQCQAPLAADRMADHLGIRFADHSANKPERGEGLEEAVESDNRIRIALYTQQSFVAQGLAAVFHTHADLELVACRDSLSGTLDCLKSTRPDVLLVHLLSGISLSEAQSPPPITLPARAEASARRCSL